MHRDIIEALRWSALSCRRPKPRRCPSQLSSQQRKSKNPSHGWVIALLHRPLSGQFDQAIEHLIVIAMGIEMLGGVLPRRHAQALA